MRASRRGAALLEVIAAMTLLMISGLAGASHIAQTAYSIRAAQSTDRETTSASIVLGRVSLWSRARLVAAAGEHAVFGYLIVTRPLGPTLFHVSVRRVQNRAIVLETILYRREDQVVSGA